MRKTNTTSLLQSGTKLNNNTNSFLATALSTHISFVGLYFVFSLLMSPFSLCRIHPKREKIIFMSRAFHLQWKLPLFFGQNTVFSIFQNYHATCFRISCEIQRNPLWALTTEGRKREIELEKRQMLRSRIGRRLIVIVASQ